MKAVDVFGNQHIASLDELTWRPSVYGIVIKDNKILLSPQNKENHYHLPGGGIEMSEPIEQALVREVKEETRIDVVIDKLISVKNNIFVWQPDDLVRRDAIHSLMIYYNAHMIGGEISTDGSDDNEREYVRQAV